MQKLGLLILLWLTFEYLYFVVSALAFRTGQKGRPHRRWMSLFEPDRADVVSRSPVEVVARDTQHSKNGSVYTTGSEVVIEIRSSRPGQLVPIRPVLHRVTYDEILMRPCLAAVRRWDDLTFDGDSAQLRFTWDAEAAPGMYVLKFIGPARTYGAVPLFLSSDRRSDVLVVVPTFTIWGYHERQGFYPGHGRPPIDLFVHRLAKAGLTGWFAARLIRRASTYFGVHLNQPAWPIHGSVKLNSEYRTNHRWSKWLWDESLADIEGLWNDDIDITIPFFALADKKKVSLQVASDISMHAGEVTRETADRLVFVGQESMTEAYWQHLSLYIDAGGCVTLWCPQGFGYREVEYDAVSSELRYICSRGKRGFWNEKLEQREPPWNEAEILGFRFPSPDSVDATNPHRVHFNALVAGTDLRWSGGVIQTGSVFRSAVWDGVRFRPGLNWMGGEPFRRVAAEAEILVHTVEDPEVIGLGRFGRVTVVSPTFLGALWAYGGIAPQLPECIFELAMGLGGSTSSDQRTPWRD